MMKRVTKFLPLSFLLLTNCADDRPYLEGHIKRAADAIMTPCDPYNRGDHHTCVVYLSAFNEKILIYDATAEEMVLAPMAYRPLNVKVAPSTNDLAAVKSTNQKFPFFFALDPAGPAIYVVRAFPSADKSQLSFSTPLIQKLDKKPHKIAAYSTKTGAIALLSYPDDGSIDVLRFDNNGIMSTEKKNIKIGVKPSHIEIDDDIKNAIISDIGSKDIHILDLSTIDNAAPTLASFDIGADIDRIFVSKRDFGLGKKDYIVALEPEGKDINLVNISDKKFEASFSLKENPMAVYFPDAQSQPCLGGTEKNWLTVAGLKGNLFYISVNKSGDKLALQELAGTVDLTSNRNMALNKIHVRKILGGSVLFDSSLEREAQCPNNRRIFLVSSYASDRINPVTLSSFEVEGQGQACEGEGNASRLGVRRE